MKTTIAILGLALVALVGCEGSQGQNGFGIDPPGPIDMRGIVDGAAGASGSAGADGAGGGSSGAGGAHVGAGGMTSAGGAPGAGGAGMAGATGSGAGGGSADYLGCDAYGWSGFRSTACVKQPTAGLYQYGSKDGHACAICTSPARPASAPDCMAPLNTLCVLSCDECTFQ